VTLRITCDGRANHACDVTVGADVGVLTGLLCRAPPRLCARLQVLQDYGAAVPMPEPAAAAPGRPVRFRTVGLVGVAAIAMALLVMAAVSTGGAAKSELVQERLDQHLMSQFSGSDGGSSDDDSMQSLSSSDGSAHWYGHWSDSSSHSSSTNWQKEVAKMQARAAARRAREDKRFFAGVDKAFGKKAGKAMLAAFNGKGKNVLTKFKLNEKKLDEQKAKIAHNTVVPTHKHAAHSKIQAKHATKAAAKKDGDSSKKTDAKKDGDASKKADAKKDDSKKADAKKAAMEKTAAKLASKKIDHEAEAKKEAAVKKLADAKKKEKQEALKVAQKMADHKDPSADKEDEKKTAPVAAKKGGDDKKADAKKAYDKEEASVVKEALKVAKHMDEHKDPVYKKPVKKEGGSRSADACAACAPYIHSTHVCGLSRSCREWRCGVHREWWYRPSFREDCGRCPRRFRALPASIPRAARIHSARARAIVYA